MIKLTQDRLKQILYYDHKSGLFYWKIKNTQNIEIGDIAGVKYPIYPKNGNNYVFISIIDREKNISKNYTAHRLAWLYMEGFFPKNIIIDHINRIKYDNRWENLRLVSAQCNLRNKDVQRNNISGITGVRKDKSMWVPTMQVNKKQIYLGRFKNKDDAVKARWNAEVKYKWSDCNTTSSAYLYLKGKNII